VDALRVGEALVALALHAVRPLEAALHAEGELGLSEPGNAGKIKIKEEKINTQRSQRVMLTNTTGRSTCQDMEEA